MTVTEKFCMEFKCYILYLFGQDGFKQVIVQSSLKKLLLSSEYTNSSALIMIATHTMYS